MIKITVIAVGKLKERFWQQACAEYDKRLQAYAKVSVVEVVDRDPDKCGGAEAAMQKEAQDILVAIPKDAFVILLAIDGKQLSSEGFSAHLDQLALSGSSNLVFLIGGSTGVSSTVSARADEKLSFGPITLPHNLARVILLEQVYRAFKISRGEPYHK